MMKKLLLLSVCLLAAFSCPYRCGPTPAPGGGRIAFVSYRDGNAEIYAMNVEDALQGTGSGEVIRLTDHPASDWYPAWSPDGKRIAFTRVADTNSNGYIDAQDTGEIYVMNAEGSREARLTDNPAWDGHPSWSPDGTHIAFESNRDGNREIYVMNADPSTGSGHGGSGQVNLTNNLAEDTYPAWSLDGKRIAFVSSRDGNKEIYVMNADGSGQANLTNNPANDGDPAWGP